MFEYEVSNIKKNPPPRLWFYFLRCLVCKESSFLNQGLLGLGGEKANTKGSSPFSLFNYSCTFISKGLFTLERGQDFLIFSSRFFSLF
jgi:hypothetical protein